MSAKSFVSFVNNVVESDFSVWRKKDPYADHISKAHVGGRCVRVRRPRPRT